VAEVFKDGKLICPLKRGDYFGETALLQKCQRMATVRAAEQKNGNGNGEELQCLSLDRDRFLKLFGSKR
jgi:hypothetical protein